MHLYLTFLSFVCGFMKFEEIAEKVKKLGLPAGKYALFGSVPLSAHSIRESNDADIIATQDVYDALKAKGWNEKIYPDGRRMLDSDCFEVGAEWTYGSYNPDPARLIAEAETIEGVPVVRLEEVLKWKKAFGREKDLRDVKLIEAYMKRETE